MFGRDDHGDSYHHRHYHYHYHDLSHTVSALM